MIKWLWTWWRSYQFKSALKQGKYQRARHLLTQIDKSGAKLSYLEKLYQQQLQTESSLSYYQQEVSLLTKKLQAASPQDYKLKPNSEFIQYIHNCFKLSDRDAGKIQCTGIEPRVFPDLEKGLVDFLTAELNKVPPEIRDREIAKAVEDLGKLKKGIDPQYNCRLSSHVYLAKYFLDNIYTTYIAWFLIYQHNLIPKNLKILDLAAGPGTTIYGLAMLLSSMQGYCSFSQTHISYYSLEQQADLQYRGLQFWRKYIESRSPSINTYYRFNTVDLFDYQNYDDKLPHGFFDFVVISHCFFYEPQLRLESHQIYQQIFQKNLSINGHVLLIVQGRKLFQAYDVCLSEDINEETMVIEMWLEELGLKLQWYKYLSCTGNRIPDKQSFHQFARDNLPPQKYLDLFRKQYLQENYSSHYAIDDYIILAVKK